MLVTSLTFHNNGNRLALAKRENPNKIGNQSRPRLARYVLFGHRRLHGAAANQGRRTCANRLADQAA
jgi:hypothetical protein